MAARKNTASVTIAQSGDEISIDFNDAALDRFGKGKGWRLTLGTAYLLADQAGREVLANGFGTGAVRRGLLVVAKGRNTQEADRTNAASLAASLRSKAADKAAA